MNPLESLKPHDRQFNTYLPSCFFFTFLQIILEHFIGPIPWFAFLGQSVFFWLMSPSVDEGTHREVG